MKYDDTWLSLEVFVDNNLTVKGNCNWHLISNYWGQYYEYRCNNRKLTQAERTKIEQEIVNTLRSQFQRFNDYVIKPLNLNYKKKFPLQVNVRRGNYCNTGTAAFYQNSNPPKIRLCTENIESDTRHEATHWLMATLNGDVPTYKMMSEGCANYFDGGACRREDLTYAFSISNNIPKIGELLIPGYQEHPHYNSYVMGRLLCASFHQSASDIHFKQLLETHRNNKDARTLESYYQASFEDFVKNLSNDFCQKYPNGIYPRQSHTTTTSSTTTSTAKPTTTTRPTTTSTAKPTATSESTITYPPSYDFNIKLPDELIYAIETRNIGYFSGALGIGFSFEKENNVIKDRKLVELILVLVKNGCDLDLLNYFFNHKGERVIDAQLYAELPGTVRELLLSECNKNSEQITRLLNLFEYIPGTKKNLLGFDPFDHEQNKNSSANEHFSSNDKKTNSKNSSHLTFEEGLTIQGIVAVVNGVSYFLLEKGAEKLKKHYPQRKIGIDRSVYFFAQPLLNSVINLAKTPALININNLANLDILQNTAINFGLNFSFGVVTQLGLGLIQFGLKQCNKEENISNTIIKTIFFLHTIGVLLNSENPKEAALGQLISSVTAMLTYFLVSLVANQFTKKQDNKSSYRQDVTNSVGRSLIDNGLFNANQPLPNIPIERNTCCRFF